MFFRKNIFYIALFLLLLFSRHCFSDLFFLKNGREIEGKIYRESDEKIWVLTYDNAKIGIKKSDIDSIDSQDFQVIENKEAQSRDFSGDSQQQSIKKQDAGYSRFTTKVSYGKNKGEGLGSEMNISGTPYTVKNYKDGEIIGYTQEYYPDGALKIRANKLNGKYEGKYLRYYESGQTQEIGFYENGRRIGLFKQYYESGKIKSEKPYSNGKLEGLAKFYYENGQTMKETVYIDNKRNGLEKEYYNNKQLLSEQEYKDGKPVGKGKKYYGSGELKEESFPEIGMSKTYYQSGELKSRTFLDDDRRIDYDKKGSITYDGPIPEEEIGEDEKSREEPQ
ncbi:MAG: toxin-antitoxin system YwqK family antitoxin [Candidatus Omnitrophica bacterium]|nr:toxin-antitoxin system YwqK family antitoxin [Candidatus Omnitrophota bacterium]